jgi:hypothetical protein
VIYYDCKFSFGYHLRLQESDWLILRTVSELTNGSTRAWNPNSELLNKSLNLYFLTDKATSPYLRNKQLMLTLTLPSLSLIQGFLVPGGPLDILPNVRYVSAFERGWMKNPAKSSLPVFSILTENKQQIIYLPRISLIPHF